MLTKNNLTDVAYLKLAVPFILSTVTQPLLGAVDTAVVGRLGNPAYIAGVSVGAVIFNTIYWLFGFLRVSTTAFSAQAQGTGDESAKTAALVRPGIFALIVGVAMIFLRTQIFDAAMRLIAPDAEVAFFADGYYRLLIGGAPLVMLNYVMLGWLMGQEKVAVSLFMQIGGNLLNIVLDLLFVEVWHMDVKGVATATLISQVFSFGVGASAIALYCKVPQSDWRSFFAPGAFFLMLKVNANLMIRTVCVLVQINLFTATGASFGTAVLSANAILYQVMMVMSYSFDGLANASSVFAGRAVGAKSTVLLRDTWIKTLRWGCTVALLTAGGCVLWGWAIVGLFTDIPAILGLTREYSVWMCIFPCAAWAGVSFYGIFTGLGCTAPVRDSTALALGLFLCCWKLFVPLWGNNGLWGAFISFYLGRSLFLLLYYRSSWKVFETNGGVGC